MANDWLVSLEQSRDLDVTRGTAAATAEAVRDGADLRLFLIARGYEETLYFQQTYVGEGDAFAGLMRHRAELDQAKADLVVDEATYAQQLDLLRFQVKEISDAALNPADEENLDANYQRASNAARLLELCKSAEFADL